MKNKLLLLLAASFLLLTGCAGFSQSNICEAQVTAMSETGPWMMIVMDRAGGTSMPVWFEEKKTAFEEKQRIQHEICGF